MAFQLPELPYPKDALEPHISAETLEFHYGTASITRLTSPT
jgi:Fe-Mn family superoxide dismutase